jgi:hypothetical protein
MVQKKKSSKQSSKLEILESQLVFEYLGMKRIENKLSRCKSKLEFTVNDKEKKNLQIIYSNLSKQLGKRIKMVNKLRNEGKKNSPRFMKMIDLDRSDPTKDDFGEFVFTAKWLEELLRKKGHYHILTPGRDPELAREPIEWVPPEERTMVSGTSEYSNFFSKIIYPPLTNDQTMYGTNVRASVPPNCGFNYNDVFLETNFQDGDRMTLGGYLEFTFPTPYWDGVLHYNFTYQDYQSYIHINDASRFVRISHLLMAQPDGQTGDPKDFADPNYSSLNFATVPNEISGEFEVTNGIIPKLYFAYKLFIEITPLDINENALVDISHSDTNFYTTSEGKAGVYYEMIKNE